MNRKEAFPRAAIGCVLATAGLMTSAPALAEVSFTPRVGVFFDNASQRTSAGSATSPNVQAFLDNLSTIVTQYSGTMANQVTTTGKSTQPAIPQYGGTLTFGIGEGGNTDIALTALYGKTHLKGDVFEQTTLLSVSVLGASAIDSIVQRMSYDNDYARLDLEATLQHRLNETFSFVGGFRAEKTTADRPTTVIETGSVNTLNALANRTNQLLVAAGGQPLAGAYVYPQGAPYTFDRHIRAWAYSLRAGAAAYSPIGEKHLFFVNGMLHITRDPAATVTDRAGTVSSKYRFGPSAETTVGPDISVGYLYRFSDRFALDARYRATIYFPISGDFDFKDSQIKHGLMVGFSTWFGGR